MVLYSTRHWNGHPGRIRLLTEQEQNTMTTTSTIRTIRPPVCPECSGQMTDLPWPAADHSNPYEWSCLSCLGGGPDYSEPAGMLKVVYLHQMEQQNNLARQAGWLSPDERLNLINRADYPACPVCSETLQPKPGTSRIWWNCSGLNCWNRTDHPCHCQQTRAEPEVRTG